MSTVQVCPQCGETFTAYPSQNRVFCSVACRAANGTAKVEPIVVEATRIAYCGRCGKVFRPTPGAPAGHCSPACRYAARLDVARRHSASVAYVPKDYPEKSCRQCAGMFKPLKTNQVFCAPLCKQKHSHEKARSAHAGQRRCACGAEVERKPGKAVCDVCKKDPRANQGEKDRRRTLRKYGVDQNWYDATLAAQGGRCAICSTDQPGRPSWSIDHCHSTGVARGLLCNHCNTAIGLMRDDPEVMRRAIEYLTRERA